MKEVLIAIWLLASTFVMGQGVVDVYGKVSICKLSSGGIYLSKRMQDSSRSVVLSVSEIKSGEVYIDKLIANVKVYHFDSLLYDLKTDSTGGFELTNIKTDTLEFKVKVSKYLRQNYIVSLNNEGKEQNLNFCISDSLHHAKYDSIFFSKIPYNAAKAKEDIKNGKVYYLHLFADDSGFDNSDFEYLEKKFGFEYLYDYLRLPSQYLKRAEEDYNGVVFDYLDKKCQCDFEAEYMKELKRMFFEKMKNIRH